MMMMMMMLVLLVMVMSREDVRTDRVSWGVGERGKNGSTSDRLVFLSHAAPFSALDPVYFLFCLRIEPEVIAEQQPPLFT